MDGSGFVFCSPPPIRPTHTQDQTTHERYRQTTHIVEAFCCSSRWSSLTHTHKTTLPIWQLSPTYSMVKLISSASSRTCFQKTKDTYTHIDTLIRSRVVESDLASCWFWERRCQLHSPPNQKKKKSQWKRHHNGFFTVDPSDGSSTHSLTHLPHLISYGAFCNVTSIFRVYT